MPTSTANTYSRKQLQAIMARYTASRLEPCAFTELPVTFAYEFSQFDGTMSCHLRTTQGVVIEVEQLVEWYEALPEDQQAEILGA